MTIPSWFVILMGLSTVFIGLISIIILCKLLGAVSSIADAKNSKLQIAEHTAVPNSTPATKPVQSCINRQEVIAAIGVAIAEEIGAPVEAIRITSIKKI